ncbi:MAG: GlsB/YeaQ/YmgE family stress response membrane protein [Mycolicibacter sinensis]
MVRRPDRGRALRRHEHRPVAAAASAAPGQLPEYAGALLGGFLLSFAFDIASGGWWFTLFTATGAARTMSSWTRRSPA